MSGPNAPFSAHAFPPFGCLLRAAAAACCHHLQRRPSSHERLRHSLPAPSPAHLAHTLFSLPVVLLLGDPGAYTPSLPAPAPPPPPSFRNDRLVPRTMKGGRGYEKNPPGVVGFFWQQGAFLFFIVLFAQAQGTVLCAQGLPAWPHGSRWSVRPSISGSRGGGQAADHVCVCVRSRSVRVRGCAWARVSQCVCV